MLRDKLNEYEFRTPFHKAKAAIYISGKRRGKSEKEIMQDIKDYFAKQAAINDINKYRSVRTMSKRDQMFNNPIKDETFDIDFRELDDYDSYYDDFSRNNKQVEADDYDRYYSARFGYGSDSYVDERIRYKMNRNDKSLLERLTDRYGKENILKEISNNRLNEELSSEFIKVYDYDELLFYLEGGFRDMDVHVYGDRRYFMNKPISKYDKSDVAFDLIERYGEVEIEINYNKNKIILYVK